MRILLIDDDEQLMEVLASTLIGQHYAVDIANTGEMGGEFILLFEFDLIVLDWILPDDDYIVKPVTGSILANRILNRLRRNRVNHE